VLVFVEENHSYGQMRAQMPYLFALARRYAYATNYHAIGHPSLPNYLALVGGSTFGVKDDKPPSSHRIRGRSVFDQAFHLGKTAKTYAESMPTNCDHSSAYPYAVKHNPWAYFTRSPVKCRHFDVPVGRPRSGPLYSNAVHGRLPNFGLVVPNLRRDAHDLSLGVADSWLSHRLPSILAGPDFRAGRLTVVVTADEGDSPGNRVLTVVMQAGLSHRVVTTRQSHYSLLGYVDHVFGAHLLRHARLGFARAFGL
jgi:phosphatidylinositol-3-phosphatase